MGSFRSCSVVIALGLAAHMAVSAQAIELETYSLKELKELGGKSAPMAPIMRRMFQPGCSLFEHANATGKSWRHTADMETVYRDDKVHVGKSNLSRRANDHVSSVRCDWQPGKRKCGVVLYPDPNQSGGGTVVVGSYGVVNLASDINDRASSVMIFCDVD